MTQAVVGALRANLGLNSAAFTRGLNQSRSSLRTFARGMRTVLAGAAVGAAAFAVGFGRSMNRAVAHADDMYKAAQALGTSTESLTQLGHAAEMSGASFETLQTGLRRVSTALEDVASGSTGPTARAFDVLGISAQNADGSLRSIDDVIGDVADAFSRMEDGAQKTAAANAIFGRSGSQLIPMLNAGRDGIQAMREEADRLGITISERAGRSAEAFRDNLTRLRRSFTGIRNMVAEALLPVFERFSDALITLMGDQELVRGISAGLVEVFKRIAIGALEVSKALYGIGQMALAASGGLAGFQDRYLEGQQRVLEMNRTIDGLIDDINNDRLVTVRMQASGLGSPDAARAWAENLRRGLVQTRQEILPLTRQLGQSMSDSVGEPMALTTESMRANIRSLGEEGARAGQALSDGLGTVFSGIGSSISEAIKGTKSWRDVAADAIGQVGQMFLRSGLQAMGGGGGWASILSSFAGSLIPGFANGTNNAPGGLAWVGERGKELVNLPRGSQVIPNHALPSPGSIGASGRQRVDLHVHLEDHMLRAFVQEEATGVAVHVTNENNKNQARQRERASRT